MRQYKITLGEMRSGKIDAMERVDAPVKTAFAASHKMARRGGEKLIWYVTIGWSNQLAHAVGLPNRLFYCSGLRIALAEPAAQTAPRRCNENRRRASISVYPAPSG